jgi:hypothetical protein
MQRLIGNALLCQLRGVRTREKGKFAGGMVRPHKVKKREVPPIGKSYKSLEWSPDLKFPIISNEYKPVALEAIKDGSKCRISPAETRCLDVKIAYYLCVWPPPWRRWVRWLGSRLAGGKERREGRCVRGNV